MGKIRFQAGAELERVQSCVKQPLLKFKLSTSCEDYFEHISIEQRKCR